MSFYEAFRDAMNMAQKADNIELYRQLLDLGAQALDLQAEVARLREENAELKKWAERLLAFAMVFSFVICIAQSWEFLVTVLKDENTIRQFAIFENQMNFWM